MLPAVAGADQRREGSDWSPEAAAFYVALYDKAKRASLSLAKLPGSHRESIACYHTQAVFFIRRSINCSRMQPLHCNAAWRHQAEGLHVDLDCIA